VPSTNYAPPPGAQLEDIQAPLDLALRRVDQPQQVYRDATPTERRVLNRAIFERIEIGPDADITGTTLTPVYRALSAWKPDLGQPKPRHTEAQAQDGSRTAHVSTFVRPRPFPPCPGTRSNIWYVRRSDPDLVGRQAGEIDARGNDSGRSRRTRRGGDAWQTRLSLEPTSH
jgi:hypothetical protein